MRIVLTLILCCFSFFVKAQTSAERWVDSVFSSLSEEERIAQLIIVRLSTIDLKTNKVTYFDKEVEDYIRKYNIGGVIVFQGAPVKQAETINRIQAIAKTPVMISIDAEWGLGQRMFDSILLLPKQMMLGAMSDSSIVYKYGKVVAQQCHRMGIHVNFAPVVDVNNNPSNPVINDRSFGENKFKVASFGIQYMKGLQDNLIMACAKHFPGHGDVAVDSHFDLPVINKSLKQLDTLELFTFKKMFEAGVDAVMNAHLYIPSIDSSKNKATSISPLNVISLLQEKLGFKGLIFTDALEMQGVQKYFPGGEASVQSLIAGNDVLCLPADIENSITLIKDAIRLGKLSADDIERHCKKVLLAKYKYVLPNLKEINLTNLTNDINSEVPEMTRIVAENAITLLAKPHHKILNNKHTTAYLAVGATSENEISKRLKEDYNAEVFFISLQKNDPKALDNILSKLNKFDNVIVGIHNINRPPLNNFGISQQVVKFVNDIKGTVILFGNAYAAKNWENLKSLIVCYEDMPVIQNTVMDMLENKLPFKGVLPVTISKKYPVGFGIKTER